MKTYRYKNLEIKPWSGPYGQHPDAEPKWYIQVYHLPTMIPWSAEHCPVTFSLREAREKIREAVALLP